MTQPGRVSNRIDPNQTSEVIVTRKCAWTLTAAAIALVSGGTTLAQADWRESPQPFLDKDSNLVFPEGVVLPRFETSAEAEYVRNQRPETERGVIGPPRQPLHSAGEYEQMAEIVMDHAGSASSSLRQIQYQMSRYITREGNAGVNFAVTSVAAGNNLLNTLTSYVAPDGGTIDMNRVRYHVRSTNAIWMCDYGPRLAYEGDIRIVNDHTYNLGGSRPLDDAHPVGYAQIHKYPLYDNGLRHGGGNFQLNALDHGFASRLITNENPSLGEAGVIARLQQYWGLNTTLFNPLPINIDGTQHLDMWVQVTGDNTVVVGDFQNNATGSSIVNAGATWFQNNGWNVFRTPNWNISGVHYTYTNTVICNNIIMVPTYTNATVAPHNAAALATFQAAMPSHQVIGIPCQNIIGLAGAIHCIVRHVPVNKNGVNPGTIVYQPNGGQTFNPGDNMNITWASDDDQKPQVLTIDIDLSLDGGATFPINIATGTADDGSFAWSVPDLYSTQAKVRVRGRDPQNNTGHDLSDLDFTINGTPPPPSCPGDANGDFIVDAADLSVILGNFGLAATGPATGDLNGDNICNAADLSVLLANFGIGC